MGRHIIPAEAVGVPPVGPGPVEMPDEVEQPAAEGDLVVGPCHELEDHLTVSPDD